MATLKNFQTEITLTVIAFVWLWFVLTNASQVLANAYLWAGGIALFLLMINILIFDKNVRVTFQKTKGKHLEAFFAGVIGWVMILIVSFVILNFVDPAKASFGAIMDSLNAANPAFSNSQIVNWLTISFAIGYLETTLFARLFEFISDRFNIPINRENKFRVSVILVILVLSLLFLIFHITSKGIDNSGSLAVVGIMMVISLGMVVYFNGETRQAIWTHIISNGVAGFLLIQAGGFLF